MTTDHRHSRSDAQTERMKNSDASGECIFCPAGLENIHKLPLEHSGDFWHVTPNAFPYEGTVVHYLIVPRSHISHLRDIPPSAWTEFGKHITWLIAHKNIDAGALFVRFGNTGKTGATLEHLHFQVLCGETSADASENERESIKVKLGYKKKSPGV